MTLVFLDTETTGLELHHHIWEIAWAVEDGPIESAVVPHQLANADPEALELNGYWKRFPWPYGAHTDATGIDNTLRQLLEGATIVGANPAFDAMRLQLRWNAQPWHYRLLDISSMAVQAFGLNEDRRPPGLLGVREHILSFYARNELFINIPEPDHTAAGDVATLRACFYALRARTEWT